MKIFLINKKLKIVLIALIILFTGIAIILYCTIYGMNAENVIGTEFIRKRVPIALSDNFGVDSIGRIYFTSQLSPLIQVFENNLYLYSLDLKQILNNYSGAKYVYITEEDNIQVFLFRTYTMATFNQKGQLLEEKELDKDEFRHLFYSLTPSIYKVERGNSLYEAEPSNIFFWHCKKISVKSLL